MYIPTFILFIQESVCTVIKCYECRHLYLPIVLSGGIQGLRIDRITKITTGHQDVILFCEMDVKQVNVQFHILT